MFFKDFKVVNTHEKLKNHLKIPYPRYPLYIKRGNHPYFLLVWLPLRPYKEGT